MEVNVSPMEGTANGILVVDAATSGIGLVRNPIRVTMKDGFIRVVEGEKEATILIQMLESASDSNAYNVAEIGIGLNQKARVMGRLLEDEGSLGTAHIGVGSNFPLGGKIQATLHIDLIFRDPTIDIDGRRIVENGKLNLR